jgi:hypothetical protein
VITTSTNYVSYVSFFGTPFWLFWIQIHLKKIKDPDLKNSFFYMYSCYCLYLTNFYILNMERPGVRKEAVLVFRTAENHILELFRLDEVKGFSFPRSIAFLFAKICSAQVLNFVHELLRFIFNLTSIQILFCKHYFSPLDTVMRIRTRE